MREIKFRAWEPYLKQMTNDPDFSAFHGILTMEADWIPMQFTGLLDKNGVEIYEGDIFDAWEGRSKYVVQWKENRACFNLTWASGDTGDSKSRHYFDMYMAEYQFLAVGNIYENPELLKGEQS